MPYYPPSSGGGGGGAGTVVVTTPSGTPSISADTIKFPQGFVTDLGSGDASIGSPAASSIGVKAYATATQSIPNNTATAVTMDSEEFDTDGFHSTSSNTSRLTIPAGLGGKYIIVAGGYWGASPGTDGELTIRKNGTTNLRAAEANPTGVLRHSVIAFADLAAGDYVELMAYQSSGGAINIGHASALSAQANIALFKLDSGNVGQAIGAAATSASDQTISTATATAVTMDSEEFDTDGFHSTSVNTSRMTIPTGLGGKYLVVGYLVWDLDASGIRQARLYKNGSGAGWASTSDAYTSTYLQQTVVGVLDLAAGDYVELMAYHDRGSNTKVVGTVAASKLTLARLDSDGRLIPIGKEVQTSSQGPTATPAGVTNVPGMSGVTVAVGQTSTVRIRYFSKVTRASSSGERNVYGYKRGGSTGPSNVEIYDYNAGESDLKYVFAEWLETGVTAGSYTYNATYRASGGTSNSTFVSQYMTVEVIPE